jgi:hypothetical protein
MTMKMVGTCGRKNRWIADIYRRLAASDRLSEAFALPAE